MTCIRAFVQRFWVSMTILLLLNFKTSSKAASVAPCSYDAMKSGEYQLTTESLLVRAVETNCASVMDAAIQKEKEGDLVASTGKFMSTVVTLLSLDVQLLKSAASDDPAAAVFGSKIKIVNSFGSYLKRNCPDETQKSEACAAKKKFDAKMGELKSKLSEALEQEQAEDHDANYRNSPQGMIDLACACDKFIALNQNIISRQREIGRVSGSVNMLELNTAGAKIVDLQKLKKEISSRYKASFKKNLINYKCTNMETAQDPLMPHF